MFRSIYPHTRKLRSLWGVGSSESRWLCTTATMPSSNQTIYDKWKELAKQQMKGKDPEDKLMWHTQGLAIKPIYTKADVHALPTGNIGRLLALSRK